MTSKRRLYNPKERKLSDEDQLKISLGMPRSPDNFASQRKRIRGTCSREPANTFISYEEPEDVDVLVDFCLSNGESVDEAILSIRDCLSVKDFSDEVLKSFKKNTRFNNGRIVSIQKFNQLLRKYQPLQVDDVNFLKDADVFKAIMDPFILRTNTVNMQIKQEPGVNQVNLSSQKVVSSNLPDPATINPFTLPFAPKESIMQQPSPSFYPPPPFLLSNFAAVNDRKDIFKQVPPFVPPWSFACQPFQQNRIPKMEPVDVFQDGQNRISTTPIKKLSERRTRTPLLPVPSNLANAIHLFIPAYWRNYPRILQGAIEEVLANSTLDDEQKTGLRKILSETIINGRLVADVVNKSKINLSENKVYHFVHKARAKAIYVLGDNPTDAVFISQTTSYHQLKEEKEQANVFPCASKVSSVKSGELVKYQNYHESFDEEGGVGTENVNEISSFGARLARYTAPSSSSDCVIDVQGHRLYLDRGLLAVYSDVLRELLKNKADVKLPSISIQDFLQLLEFIYPTDNQCMVTVENVECLSKLANRFQIPSVLIRCEKFLDKCTNYTLAKKIYLAQQYKLFGLQVSCIDKCKSPADLEAITLSEEYRFLEDGIVRQLVNNMSRRS